VLFVWTHPVAGLQESSVQGFPSSHDKAFTWTQPVAGLHESLVHTLPSSQAALLSVWTQPEAGSQESLVQAFPSLQLGAGPPTHAPPEHVSPVVHALLSLHAAALSTCTQPDAGLHESSVQTFPSLQLSAPPLTQVPPAQMSPVVQALPSSQAAVLAAWTQPLAGLQESSVQAFPSSQLVAEPLTHAPFTHVSPVVHAFPSSHAAVLLV
jgi:hypothetical protein